jgi:hypothetical protein
MDSNTLKELGQLPVLDENGKALQLSVLWQEQRTVLIFVRHFG